MIRIVLFLILLAHPLAAAEIQVPARPGALAALIESGGVRGGDVLRLAPGDHGEIRLRDIHFQPPVSVLPASGMVRLTGVRLRDSSGWRFTGLTIRPDGSDDGPMVRIRDSRDVVIQSFDIATGRNPARWTKAQWRARARTGIRASGTDIRLIGNRIVGADHGIEAVADGALVENNTIHWFAGDGIRALGDHSIYRGNVIDTCVAIDGNHDDGIQSWSRGPGGQSGQGTVRDVLIEGNLIRNGRAGRLTCELQGIGFFDGMFQDVTIRSNAVIVNHWHGITVMGARDVVITGNLVVDADETAGGTPWISITAHKDGRLSRGGHIARNILQPWSGGSNATFRLPQPGVTVQDNTTVPSARAGIALWNRGK